MDCAKGAALMTQTTYEVKVLTAVHQVHGNKALAELIFRNIKAVGKPEYTEKEETFAKALQENTKSPLKGLDYAVELIDTEKEEYKGGSSDVGDVTLVVPCATIGFPTRVPGDFPGHHWAVVASGISSFAHKGIAAGAKVGCCTTYDLLTRSELLAQIGSEFKAFSKEHPYKTFLPDIAQPPLGWNANLMAQYRGKLEKFYINS